MAYFRESDPDFCHTHAGQAMMNGVSAPVVSRILGHSNTRMALDYAHLTDRDIKQGEALAGQAIAAIL